MRKEIGGSMKKGRGEVKTDEMSEEKRREEKI